MTFVAFSMVAAALGILMLLLIGITRGRHFRVMLSFLFLFVALSATLLMLGLGQLMMEG